MYFSAHCENEKKEPSLLEIIRGNAETDAKTIKDYLHNDGSFEFYKHIIASTLKVFQDGIHKLKFALVLPYLIEEQCELEHYLSSDLLKQINTYCEKLYLTKLIERNDTEMINNGIQTINLDFQILQAVEILQNNPNLSANLDIYLKYISNIGKRILNSIYIIEQVAATRLWVAVLSIETNENSVLPQNLENANTKKFSALILQMQENEDSLKKQIEMKRDLVQAYNLELIRQKKQLNLKKHKTAIHAQTQIEEICSKHESTRLKLEEEVAEIKTMYETYQLSNIETDRKLRDRKKRFLIQLQAWIKKYEDDVTKKVREHYRIEEKIIDARRDLAIFMITFHVQEKDYLHIWRKKEAEKELSLRKRIKSYQKNRAARTIQRYWRLLLDKKKKKRGRRG